MLPNIITVINSDRTQLLNILPTIIILICVWSIILAVAIDFLLYYKRRGEKEKKSIVETGSMFVFFLIFYSLIKFRIAQIAITNQDLHLSLIIIGILLIIIGCIFNIIGRFNLGKNWANQIKIYNNHSLINSGVYKIVRHPLYASLIWMFFGASIAYLNMSAFLVNCFIFIPFMTYRARQEETLLLREFPEYKNYQKEVAMFYPKFFLKNI